MTGLLHAELIKLRTTRTALGFGLISLLFVLAIVILSATLGDPATVSDKREVINAASIVSTILIVFGVVGATGEHRHGTITSTFLIAPDRIRPTLAKLIAYAVAGALFLLAMQVIAAVVGAVLMSGADGPSLAIGDYLEVAGIGMLACALCAALGVAVGALIRNQVAAVVGILVWLFILEQTLLGLVPDVGRFSISGASSTLLGMDFDGALSQSTGGLVLLAWVLVLGAAAVAADRARDVT